MMPSKIVYCFVFVMVCMICSCVYDDYQPKPRGYSRVTLPKHAYTTFSENGFPYLFEYPVYGKPVKDTVFFDKKPENPYWMNIEFEQFNAKIYLTYKIMNGKQDLGRLIEDAYKMTNAHEKKADFIDDPTFHNDTTNVHGVFFDVGGNTASALQFFATDSQHHFLRGALYFNVTPNADSLRPANQFMREDVVHLIKTLKWSK
jgi:gliding motility-associated lipoprotein GldD